MLGAFTPKEIRTCARLLRRAGRIGLTAQGIIDHSDYLTELAAVTPDGIQPAKRISHKRTPEERAARKEVLAKTEYGKRKFKP